MLYQLLKHHYRDDAEWMAKYKEAEDKFSKIATKQLYKNKYRKKYRSRKNRINNIKKYGVETVIESVFLNDSDLDCLDLELGFATEDEAMLDTVEEFMECDRRINKYTILCNTPDTSKMGMDRSKPAILYLLEVENPNDDEYTKVYKIGITTNTVEKRYELEDVNYEIIEEVEFSTAGEAEEFESEIKACFSVYSYQGISPFRYTGITEVFTVNIFEEYREERM